MPNLNDIVEVAEALETKPVLVAEARCVVVRNRNVRCRKCVEACPVGAIAIDGNTLALDSGTCVSCGACTVVCPTEALIPIKPLDEDLASSVADATITNDGVAVFACARIASKRLADSNEFAEVPCLARMEESILVELVAQGVQQILFVDGTCSTCKFHACNAGIDATVASANTLLAAMGSSVRVKRQSAFPEEMLVTEDKGHYGVSRRGFFTQARGTARDAAGKTVATVLKEEKDKKAPSIREKLRMTSDGTLPQLNAERRMHILDAMDRIGEPQVSELETRLWGRVDVEKEGCRSCDMCAMFCPTGALRKGEEEEPADSSTMSYGKSRVKPASDLEFSMAECVQCRTCEDICLNNCLKVDSTITLEELFDFEPRIIPRPAPPAKNTLFKTKRH